MPRITVVESTRASPLRRALLAALVERLRERDAEVVVSVDRLPSALGACLVLDPHDGLERIASAPEITRLLAHSIVLSTAAGPDGRPRDRPFLEAAAAGAVSSPLLASRLASEGHRVELVGIGYDESFLGPPQAARTIDVAVLLPSAGGRDQVVAEIARVVASRPHELRLDYTRDLLNRSATELDVAERRSLLARTRVVLFAPDELNRPCLDWLHLHDVFANGCCVLTSRTMDLAPLVPSRHLVTAGPASVALVLDRLLADGSWERQVAEAGRSLVQDELSLSETAGVLLELADSLPSASGRRFVPSTRSAPSVDRDASAADVVARIALQNAEFRRTMPQRATETTTVSAGYSRFDPEVSVVVPLHNYAEYVESAIESALAATGVRAEVVIVDDVSTDGSAAMVASIIAREPERAILLRRLAAQGGPGAGRNVGFELARAPLVYTLDADDLLCPRGLERLVRAIGTDEAAGFAYGVIERFDEAGPVDLVATQGFEVGLFAYGNFLPAMALTRKAAWKAVGGYAERGLLQLGWEDYDFWLRLIDAGYRAVWTPTLVARYRKHGESMLSLTNLVAEKLERHIRAEHPAIFEAALA